ncbi:hypothetical protein BP5796_04771 [Coleophoma crateriformis]|uniref:Uncharacterized protein n=1 Tax=Coleophoma crateriformis TaxID=565419 RepID=A0A3D8SAI7_9HELO|nr:hypothetical protein BP5796_04771 [Coleophoma crateriformis]
MSSRNQHPYKWPSPPPARATSYGSQSTASPFSLRRLPEHAIPTGTVASRVQHLQSLQKSASSGSPGSNAQITDTGPSRTNSGRRVSSQFGQPATRSARPDEEPQVQNGHSYLGHRTSRSNHREEHAFTGSKPPSQRPASSQTARIGYTDDNSPWSTPTRRRVSAYRNALRDYSRQEMDRITETDSQYGVHVDLPAEYDQVGTVTSRVNNGSSTNGRRESVREMFRQYGIERPAALMSSTDPSHLDEPITTHKHSPESNQHNAEVPDKSPGNEKQERSAKVSHAPPTPPPLPSPKPSSQSSQGSKKQEIRIPKTDDFTKAAPSPPEERLILAEDIRHEKERKEHNRKQRNSPLECSPKVSGEDRTSSVSTRKSHQEHRSLSSKSGKHSSPRELDYTKAMAPQGTRRDNPRKPHPTALKTSSSAFQVRRASVEKYRRKSLKPKQQSGSPGSDAVRKKLPSRTHAFRRSTSLSPNEHIKQPVGNQQPAKRHHGRVPDVSSPLAAHKPQNIEPNRPGNISIHTYSSPSPRTYASPASPQTTEKLYIKYLERTVPAATPGYGDSSMEVQSNQARRDQNNSARLVQSRPQHIACSEHQSPLMSGARISTEEDYSFVVGRPDVMSMSHSKSSTRDVPTRYHSPKHHNHHTRIHGRQNVPPMQSSSSSVTADSPMSTCGTPTCRATHSGHAPYRHSISCIEKRNVQHLSELVGSGYAAGLSESSEPGEVKDASYFDLLPQRPRGKRDNRAPVRNPYRATRPADYYQHHRESNARQVRRASPSSAAHQCRKCSGYLDRCHHCRDDCQCDNCQAIIEFTKHFVRQEQSRRHSAATKHSRQKKTEPTHLSVPEGRNPISSSGHHVQKPDRRPSGVSNVILPEIASTQDELTYSDTQGQACLGSATSLPKLTETDAHPSKHNLVSKPQPIVSVKPVLAPTPVHRTSNPPNRPKTDSCDTPLPMLSQENHKQPQAINLQTPPRAGSNSRTRSSSTAMSLSLLKPLENDNKPQHSMSQSQSTVIRKTQGSKQRSDLGKAMTKGPSFKEGTDSNISTRSTLMSHSFGLDSRLPEYQVHEATRKASVQGTPEIRKILTQHKTSEGIATTPPPWHSRSKISQLPIPKYRSPSSLAVASVQDYPSSYPMPDQHPSALEGVSLKTFSTPMKEPAPMRSSSEELQKNSPSICRPRMNIRRPQRHPSRASTHPKSSMERSRNAIPLLSRPHTSMEQSAPIFQSQALAPGTTVASAASSAISCPKTSLSKGFTPGDVGEGEAESSLRKVSRKISTLFRVKEKRSTPQLSREKLETKEIETTSKSIDSQEKGSKALTLVHDKSQKRKGSLTLKGLREDSPKSAPKDVVRKQFSSHIQELGSTKAAPETAEDPSGPQGGSPESTTVNSQTWSHSGKGLPKEPSPSHSGAWSVRIVDGSSKAKKGYAGSESVPKHERATMTHSRSGLVSSKVKAWNRDIALFEQASALGSTDMNNLECKIARIDSDEAEISDGRDAAAKSSPGGFDDHDCVWKTLYLLDYDQEQNKKRIGKQDKLGNGAGFSASRGSSTSAGGNKGPGITGVTVLIHRRDRDDLVVKGGIISRA